MESFLRNFKKDVATKLQFTSRLRLRKGGPFESFSVRKCPVAFYVKRDEEPVLSFFEEEKLPPLVKEVRQRPQTVGTSPEV